MVMGFVCVCVLREEGRASGFPRSSSMFLSVLPVAPQVTESLFLFQHTHTPVLTDLHAEHTPTWR